jgi:osmoprotectant transport system permease protein
MPGTAEDEAIMLHTIVQFLTDPQNQFWAKTVTTLKLSIVPFFFALVIAAPIGVLVAQRPVLAFLAVNFSGLARAIPTLAFLAIMLPYLGTGFLPAAVALTALGVPPILLNTVEGLRGIDPATTDAASGMGMTSMQILTRIQVPLVLPVFAAGARTALLQIVATVPIAALIGAGGYGDYITLGLSNEVNLSDLVLGAIAIALVALLAELGMATLQRAVTPLGLRSDKELQRAQRDETGSAATPDTPVVSVR